MDEKKDERKKPRVSETPPEQEAAPSPEAAMVEYASGLGNKALNAARGFGQRVFVHVVSIVCGLAAWSVTNSATAGISVYAGLICLVARGISMKPQWLGPFGAGAAQTLILLIAGVFPPFAIFWGGAQTWIQRLLLKKLNMGTEWLALLLLLPGAIHMLSAGGFYTLILPLSLAVVGVTARLAIIAFCREPGVKTPEVAEEPEKVARHRASLADLRQKLPQLPKSARAITESIAATTDRILDCMARDASDLEPGHRFCNRYLTAVHSLVDKHIRLARENVITPDIVDALAKSEGMLSRLDDVFQKEHEYLLKNDMADFSADLSVIDTLLKMDGRK